MNTSMPSVQVELVTPQIAKDMLNSSPGNPRWAGKQMVNPAHLRRFVGIIETGNWHPSIGTIQINTENQLVDGHHRLSAIVLTGLPVWVVVSRGVSAGIEKHIDQTMMKRSANQSARAAGIELLADKTVTAAARVMAFAPNIKNVDMPLYLLEPFAEPHRDALLFATNLLRDKRKRFPAPVFGAFARAYYHVDTTDLETWGRELVTGHISSPVLVNLRDKLMGGLKAPGGSLRELQYRLTTRTLRALHNGEQITRLHPSAVDDFPLPF
jgi:hypothetical protein